MNLGSIGSQHTDLSLLQKCSERVPGYKDCLRGKCRLDLHGVTRAEVVPYVEKYLNSEFSLPPVSTFTLN